VQAPRSKRQVEAAQAEYCENLKAYGQAVQNVCDLPDTATVEDDDDSAGAAEKSACRGEAESEYMDQD
jgi:hypothetical protein